MTTSGSSAFLIDTNILVYTHDPRNRAKQGLSRLVVRSLIRTRRAALSVQCLSEFFRVSTQRLPEPLTKAQALEELERFTHSCQILEMTSSVILEGARGAIRHNLSIWDALIWAIAKLNQVPFILTEDSDHNRTLEGIRYLNPFVPEFDIRSLYEDRL